MTATTPVLPHAEKLGPLASRYVEVESLPWKPTPCVGIDMKVLVEDKETGLLTALFRWQPGAEERRGQDVANETEYPADQRVGADRRDRAEQSHAVRCRSKPASAK